MRLLLTDTALSTQSGLPESVRTRCKGSSCTKACGTRTHASGGSASQDGGSSLRPHPEANRSSCGQVGLDSRAGVFSSLSSASTSLSKGRVEHSSWSVAPSAEMSTARMEARLTAYAKTRVTPHLSCWTLAPPPAA